MALDSGYSYLILDSYTFPTNPLVYLDPQAEKKIIPVVTLTKTITQHWQKRDSDRTIHMEFPNISKTMKDTLETKDEASYTSYSFTDLYGTSWTVVISHFSYRRRTTIDSDGYEAVLDLQIISKP